eukprot:4499342-Ditylum_brightwellii.AAC.1
MRKKKENLVHHHNLKIRQNNELYHCSGLDISVNNEDSDNKAQSKKRTQKKKHEMSTIKKGTTKQYNEIPMQASREVSQQHE